MLQTVPSSISVIFLSGRAQDRKRTAELYYDMALPPEAAVQPRTYRELFSDAVNSPAPERIDQYLQGYHFTDGGTGTVPVPAKGPDSSPQ